MTDSEVLNWIADRFVFVHGESENVDFVQRLRAIANRSATPADTATPNRKGNNVAQTDHDRIQPP